MSESSVGLIFEELIGQINNIFPSDNNWTWVNDAPDQVIESTFYSALHLESKIKTIMEKEPEILPALNAKLQLWCGNQNRCAIYNFNEFETACDRLLTVFLTNTKFISNTALSKAFHQYTIIFPKDRFEKLYQKIISQCAMSSAVLTIIADCDLEQELCDRKVCKELAELPMLVNQGSYGLPTATTLIQDMMFKSEMSLKTLLNTWLFYEEKSIVQLFVQGTIVNTLKAVDDNYVKFWKLLLKITLKDNNLLTKLTDKYPKFLSILERFIIYCAESMQVSITNDFEVQWDSQKALVTHLELIGLIKSVVSSKGCSSIYIKETLNERQLAAMGETDSDQSRVWNELAVACFN